MIVFPIFLINRVNKPQKTNFYLSTSLLSKMIKCDISSAKVSKRLFVSRRACPTDDNTKQGQQASIARVRKCDRALQVRTHVRTHQGKKVKVGRYQGSWQLATDEPNLLICNIFPGTNPHHLTIGPPGADPAAHLEGAKKHLGGTTNIFAPAISLYLPC